MTTNTAAQVESALRSAQRLHRAGQLEQAHSLCLQALRLRPQQPQAITLLGIIAAQTGDPARAATLFGEALAADPGNAAAHHNLGNALRALGRPAAAVASYDSAIALQASHAPTYNNRGRALFDLQRYEEAVASHDGAIALHANYAAAHFGRGRALIKLMRYEAAIEGLDRAIALDPAQPGAWYLRGNALYSLERFEAAAASYERAIALEPTAEAYHNRGNALVMLARHEDAIASYDEAIALDPSMRSSSGERLHARMQVAEWRDFAMEVACLSERVERGEATPNPFVLLAACDSAPLQRQGARNWVRAKWPATAALPPLSAGSRHDRIRVGYFSAELHNHATAALTAGLFETHDRSRFQLTAFSLGPDTRDEMRGRIEAAFEHFLDVRGKSDTEIAQLARSLEIDIAVDLGGFTRGGRPGVFALRAAPLQVSYLGYLGTMGADYMDYLIADETIIPAAYRRDYSEKIVYLPSYQVNDSKRCIAPKRFSREELGLPPAGFVFCCFNSTYKITPSTFDGWMRILARVPGSVLYLLGGSASLESNLRREARARGVAAERILFGARLAAAEYLARYRVANLFLDTLPYNAGTTASDALWAGLPVLTCTGQTFASRVGASLLTAVGLPELIASTPREYERLAVDLATHPQRLADVTAKLAVNLRTAPLFDTTAATRHLEAAYVRMYDRHLAGLQPGDIHPT